MTDRELMQMALEALDSDNPHIQVGAAISLRYRLAQLEPEPVLWVENLTDPQPHAVTDLKYCSVADRDSGKDQTYIQLYTAPPKREWVGLTDEEAWKCWDWEDFQGTWKSMESKLKEKNT